MSNNTVFITGCNRGIGRAIVERFLKKDNVNLIVHARKETPNTIELINNWQKYKNATISPVFF